MKIFVYNFRFLIRILFIVISSKVWANSIIETLDDERAILKIPEKIPCVEMDFYTAVKQLKSENNEDKAPEIFKNSIENMLKNMLRSSIAFCRNSLNDLEVELENIIEISKLMGDIYDFEDIKTATKHVIENEGYEWKLRGKIIRNDEIFLEISEGKVEKINILKSIADKWSFDNNKTKYPKNFKYCLEHYGNEYINLITETKLWLFAQQMFGNPYDDGRRVPSEYIRSDWKILIDQLKFPFDRFAITSITKELNFSYWMKTKNDLQSSVDSMKLNLLRYNFLHYSKYIRNSDLIYRNKIINVILSEPLTLKNIDKRIKAIERITEGAVRSVQTGVNISNESITMFIKNWLMTVQMFTVEGWNDNQYGTTIATSTLPKLSNFNDQSIINATNSLDLSRAELKSSKGDKGTARSWTKNRLNSR